jgi:hypothetical protein
LAWVESASEHFLCRHSSADARDAARVLGMLEDARNRLANAFPRLPDGLAVVLHGSDASLIASNPLLPGLRRLSAPAARRYVTGWAGRRELHVLAPAALRERASGAEGSAAMLERTPASLYARRVVIECNPGFQRGPAPARAAVALRWAWLLEGASRWWGGETAHARAAIGRRLREGGRVAFPPGPRDAVLLGGTVIDLLAREEGDTAAARFACRLHPGGPRAALAAGFGGRALVHTEGTWRAHLARLAGGR